MANQRTTIYAHNDICSAQKCVVGLVLLCVSVSKEFTAKARVVAQPRFPLADRQTKISLIFRACHGAATRVAAQILRSAGEFKTNVPVRHRRANRHKPTQKLWTSTDALTMEAVIRRHIFLALPVALALGGWRCDVCQDAAATFRSQFPPLGMGNMMSGVAGTIDPESLLDPVVPSCSTFGATSLADDCKTLRGQLRVNPRLGYQSWASLSAGATPFAVCVDMKKCQSTPACVAAADHPDCLVNPTCPQLADPGCAASCPVCVWLMRAWPRFKGMCAPSSGESNGADMGSRFAAAGQGAGSFEDAGRGAESLADAGLSRDLAAVEAMAAAEAEDAEDNGGSFPGDAASAPTALSSPPPRDAGGSSAEEGSVFAEVASGSIQPADDSAGGAADGSPGAAPESGDDQPWPLTASEWRATTEPRIIPDGLGSTPLLSSLKIPPAKGDAKVVDRCFYVWWALLATRETWPVLWAASGSAAGTATAAWDPYTACRCLGQCPYNSIDALGIADACGVLG